MDENGNRFEVISSKISKANLKKSNGFGKTVLVPFVSGIMGCALVIGTCFGVPSIKEKLTGSDTSSKATVQTSSGTTSNLISLSNYSNTAVFAANKILPSIVGIKLEYTVNSRYRSFLYSYIKFFLWIWYTTNFNSNCYRLWNYY